MGQIGTSLPYAEWLISMTMIIPTTDAFDTTVQTAACYRGQGPLLHITAPHRGQGPLLHVKAPTYNRSHKQQNHQDGGQPLHG